MNVYDANEQAYMNGYKAGTSDIKKKDTEINILIRKNETLKDEVAELQHKIASCNSEIEKLTDFLSEVTEYNNALMRECVESEKELQTAKAEIERLRNDFGDANKIAKAEAIKEFAERLERYALCNSFNGDDVNCATIYKIAKEMAGDK